MNTSQMEKAARWFARIKELDEEIIRLEQYATKIVNDEVEIDIGINSLVESEVPQADAFSSIWSAMPEYFGGTVTINAGRGDKMKSENFKNTVSNKTALLIFSILLKEKQYAREQYINNLTRLGVIL